MQQVPPSTNTARSRWSPDQAADVNSTGRRPDVLLQVTVAAAFLRSLMMHWTSGTMGCTRPLSGCCSASPVSGKGVVAERGHSTSSSSRRGRSGCSALTVPQAASAALASIGLNSRSFIQKIQNNIISQANTVGCMLHCCAQGRGVLCWIEARKAGWHARLMTTHVCMRVMSTAHAACVVADVLACSSWWWASHNIDDPRTPIPRTKRTT